MLPHFVIIGAQKSASTFLQICLNDHPDVYMPQGETTFFESPDYEQANGNIRKLEELFENRKEKMLGIKRPNYIGKPEVPKRIETHLPNAKLIAILRNPIDRAISAYYYNINYGFIPPINVEQGMRQMITQHSYLEKYKRSHEIIEFGYYYKYLKEYEHFRKNEQLIILLQEEIASNPIQSIQKLYDFLGVYCDFTPRSLSSHPQASIYNLTRLKLLRIKNRCLYDYNTDRTRLFHKKMNFTEKLVTRFLIKLDRSILSKVLQNKKPEISIELQNMLYEKYADDIEALERLIDKDLSRWKPNNGNL
jgi:hypothetical protein